MSIVLALVDKNQEKAQKQALLLEQAVDKGNAAKTDQYADELLELANVELYQEISEDQWRQFLEAIREKDPKFISLFLLNQKDIETILALPDKFEKIITLAKEAKSGNALLLELPVEHGRKKGLDDD